MSKFALYCKSYRNDLDRAQVLARSVERYNKDNIPFYLSVPKSDLQMFKDAISNAIIIADEEIVDTSSFNNIRGWISQQIVKSNFWKMGVANYLMVDSDSQFIRNFYLTDFMYSEDIPYTVCHEQKELWNWSVTRVTELGFNPKVSFVEDRLNVMRLFGRQGRVFDFGPGPVIWSAKVWEQFDEILRLNNLTWLDAMKSSPSEFTWYGETLLYTEAIKLVPIEPPFKYFHYVQIYNEHKRSGITLEHLAQNYLGIVIPSTFPEKILLY